MFETFFEANYKEASGAQLFHELISAISKVVDMAEYKDTHHAERVAVMSLRLARHYGLSDTFQLAQVYFAGLLHDVGEIGIPDSLLNRKSKLNPDEFQLLTTHTKIGRQIVEQVPVLSDASEIVFWHHERWDGTGYPEGLTADETPITAQIVSLMDALDNIRTHGLFTPPSEWREELRRFSGIQFNPHLVGPAIYLCENRFLDNIELNEDEIAILRVLDQDERVSVQLKQNYVTTIINFFATLLEAKHRDSASHAKRVSRLARKIGERIGLSKLELETLEIAGYLHDIGKMGIPNSILEKPGPLTQEEFEMVKKHPIYSAEILSPLSGFADVALAVKHHHERWDGTGYMGGLKGEEIPLLSRILLLADVADFLAHLPEITRSRETRIGRAISDTYGGVFDPELSRYQEFAMIESLAFEA